MIQWLRLYASNARGMASVAGQETKIPHAPCHKKKKKKSDDEKLHFFDFQHQHQKLGHSNILPTQKAPMGANKNRDKV